MSDGTKNTVEMFKGFTAGPEVAGVIRIGSMKAMSIVYTDGRILPFVAGGAGEGGGQGGDGGQNNAGNNAAQGGGQPQKVEFTPEVQAKVQEIIDKVHARAKKEASDEIAAHRAEIDKLKAGNGGQPNAGGNNNAGQGGNEEVKKALEALNAKSEKIEADRAREKASSLQKIKGAEVVKALGKYNVVNAEEIAELVDSKLDIDDSERISIKGANGPKLSLKTGENMTLDEFLSGWLAERPHHLRSSGIPGAGSQGASGLPGGRKHNLQDPMAWKEMPREDLNNLLKEGVNIHLGSGQVMKFKEVKNPFLEARRERFKKH